MIFKYLVPLLALAGLTFAVRTVIATNRPLPVQPPLAEPPRAPFEAVIAAAGIVESASENVALSTPLPGLVVEVRVQVGAAVAPGELLFRLDARAEEAELTVAAAASAAAEARLARLMALPRVEDLRAAEARAVEAEAELADALDQLRLVENVSDARAISVELRNKRRFAVQVAEARRATALAQLDWQKTGAWPPDLAIAEAELTQARARVVALEIARERLSIRAPFDGTVLQVNVRSGEYASTGALARPLILFGDTRTLHVRADIDESETWRFDPAAKAQAFLRGNRDVHTQLELVRVEPYVVPKRSLSGDSTERVDTRVLQVLYRFDPARFAAFVGQQVDVYIEAQAVAPVPTTVPGR